MTYHEKIIHLIATGQIRRGGVQRVDVVHREDCPAPQGGRCRCDPDIVVNGKKVEVPTS